MATPSYSFVDLREAIDNFTQLRSEVAALAAKIDSVQSGNASAIVGALVDGAMSLVNQRLAQFEAKITQHEQYMANLELQLRAAIPKMPDMIPLANALQELAGVLGQQAGKAPADPPGLAALTQTVAKLSQGQQDLCAQLVKPVVREGVADLPSGQVKLRITETRR